MKHNIIIASILLFTVHVYADNSADNTKINERDRATAEKTADQQTNGTNDMNITRQIRKDKMKEENFSTYAKNIKVISVNGKVTLKGPVKSQSEQIAILEYARSAAGASNVTNEMTVVDSKKIN